MATGCLRGTEVDIFVVWDKIIFLARCEKYEMLSIHDDFLVASPFCHASIPNALCTCVH